MYRRTTKLDMHIHTPSSDGHGRPEDYIRAIEKAGLDGIVITDHHTTRGPGVSDRARERAAGDAIQTAVKKAGYTCLRGCEYSSGNGHVLIYGVNVEDLGLGRYTPMQEVIDRALAAGGVAFPSHPFHGYKKMLGAGIFKLKNLVAVEGYNGQLAVTKLGQDENASAVDAGVRMGLGIVGNSDAHQAQRIGTCYTEFKGLIRWEHELVEALKDRSRYRPVVNKSMVREQTKLKARGYSLRDPVQKSYSGWTYGSPKQLPTRVDSASKEAGDTQGGLWDDLNDPFYSDSSPSIRDLQLLMGNDVD